MAVFCYLMDGTEVCTIKGAAVLHCVCVFGCFGYSGCFELRSRWVYMCKAGTDAETDIHALMHARTHIHTHTHTQSHECHDTPDRMAKNMRVATYKHIPMLKDHTLFRV